MSQLPKGWVRSKLGEICEPPEYGWTTSGTDTPGRVKLLRATDISSGAVDWSTVPWCSEEPSNIDRYALRENDLLITRTGAGVGRAFLIGDCPVSVFASYLIRFRANEEVNRRYVAHFLTSPEYWTAISEGSAGIAQPNVNATKLIQIELPLAPVQEQDRIVAEIEKQLTRLDAATTALKRVQANLKRYRTSVFKAACEGRLVSTEAELARKERRNYEPASELLKRILSERRTRWETDALAKMKASGRSRKDDRWKRKYKEPSAPDTSDLSQLPEGWCWASLDQLSFVQGGITKGQKRKVTDKLRLVPYLRVANVQRGFLDLSEVKEIEATENEIAELSLAPGDILFNEGGDRDKLGRGWVWEGQVSICIHQNHVFRARLVCSGVEARYVSIYANTFGQQYFFDEGKHTTNLASISMTKLKALPIPLPPTREQTLIVEKVASIEDEITREESAAQSGLKKSANLRRAMLSAAFSGKLVPQNPSDEPASVLLERIRTERLQKNSGNRQKRTFASQAVVAVG